jgi:type I restriction enzyme S subunit
MRNDMNWENKKLGEVYDVRDGTHDSPKYIEVGYPLVTSKNLKNGEVNFEKVKFISDTDFININKRSKVDKGDVLFAMIGTIGNPTLITEEPNYAIKNVALFKVGKEQNGQYLKYYLESDSVVSKMLEDAKGTTQKFVGLGYLRSFEIPIPTLEEQKAIVAKLDQAFAAIDQAKANIEKNIANAKELFQSKLNQIFSQKAEGWEEKKLGEVVQFTNGRNQKEVLDVNGEYPILGSAGNIMGYATNFLCKKGTVIIGRKGNISKPLFIDFKFWNVDTAFGLFPKNKIMLPKFNYYVCLNIDFASHNKGTTIPSLVKSDLIEIKVSYPISLEIQQQIVTQLDQLQGQTNLLVTKYQQKLANLEELKKSILEKAFKGELV